MTDVRLTALNPVDSQVYPVACNTSGELIVEQVDPGPDLTVTGNLTVNGTATFDSTSTFDDTATFDDATFNGSGTFAGSVNLGLLRVVADGTTYPRILATPDGTFYSESSAGVYPWNLNPNGSATFSGGASFGGDITCSDNTKGLILKSPNGTSYRLSVANDGSISTSQA
jgi:hypothetical protein|tara:strand:+ start:58 stop:567 length:510 start_codon:yes stop_codon:yes gene_type:complete